MRLTLDKARCDTAEFMLIRSIAVSRLLCTEDMLELAGNERRTRVTLQYE
jgi:hypothetical protein